MNSSITSQLSEWLSGEMSFLPSKFDGSTCIPLDCGDLEFLVQGHGKDLWNHVMKFVHSMRKVECIRKNILISRLKRHSTFKEIQKSDYVGKKIYTLHVLKNIRCTLHKAREDNQKTQANVRRMNNYFKIAKCKNQYQLGMTDDAERRLILLRMAGEAAQIKVDLCNSTENYFILERPGMSSCDFSLQQHPLTDYVEEFRDIIPASPNVLENAFIPRAKPECKCFLDRCCYMAKELLDEKLTFLNGEPASRNLSVMSEQSIITTDSNYWSFMECEEQKFINPKFDAKKKELRKYVVQNTTCFQAQQLYKALLELTSGGIAQMARLYVQDGSDEKVRLLGNKEDHLKEVKQILYEKSQNLSCATVINFIAAAQERILVSRIEEDLRNLILEMESQLKEIFSVGTGLLENTHELIHLENQQASIGTVIQYLKQSAHEMQMEIYNKTSLNQLRKLDAQIKEMDTERVHHGKVLENLQRTREDIKQSIFSNHCEVQKCLTDIRALKFMRKLEDFEVIPGLLDREIMALSECPLEYLMKTTLSSGRTVPDFQLLLNSSMWGSLIVGKENNEAISTAFCQWVKATLGKAPHSSADAIFLAAAKAKRKIHELSSARSFRFLFDDQILQNNVAKISDLQAELDEDEKKWLRLMSLATSIYNDHIKLVEEQLNEAEVIYQNWLEGVINKCIPEDVIVSGKNFKQWNHEIQPAASKITAT